MGALYRFNYQGSSLRLLKSLSTAGLAFCILFSGCGKREVRVAVYKVVSKVVDEQGQPVPNATVILHPKSSSANAPKSRGTTDETGQFRLTTYDTDDGAPEGEYTVTVEQWLRDDPNNPPTNHLPPKLAAPSSSGIQVTIAKGENELQPIVLR